MKATPISLALAASGLLMFAGDGFAVRGGAAGGAGGLAMAAFAYPATDHPDASPAAPAPPAGGCAGERALLMCLLAGSAVGAWLEERQVEVSGWTAASFTGSSRTAGLQPIGFNDLGNRFLLQQNWLRIQRAADGPAGAVRLGFRSDWILPGSDYRFNVARGLFDGQLRSRAGEAQRYGIDPAQFYGEMLLPGVARGLSLRLGRFFAPFGVENVGAVDTPLVSRSYTFIYDPFTQTGLLGSLRLGEGWSVKGGLVAGNDVFIDEAASPHVVGGFGWAAEGGRSTVDVTTVLGRGRFDAAEQFHNPQIFDLVCTRRFGDSTVWTLEALYGFTGDVPGLGFAAWHGVVNYLTHTLDARRSATFRLEFFDDEEGQRTGRAGLYSAATAGFSYRPTRWLGLRPELRIDHHDGAAFDDGGAPFTATLEAIVRW